MAEGGGEAWATFSTSEQEHRRRMCDLENIMGRQLSATPSYLTRALYVPRHGDDDGVSHLPLYDISKRYKEAIGDTPVGSSMYIVKLGTMGRPKGDGTDGVEVSYLVDFYNEEEDDDDDGVTSAKVQRRKPLKDDEDDEVSL